MTGIIVILIAVLLPSIRKSMRQAAATVCMHNLKQISEALDLYKLENNGWVPFTTGSEGMRSGPPLSVWFHKLVPSYMKEPGVLICPDDPLRLWLLRNDGVSLPGAGVAAASYGMNEFILSSPDRFLCNLERWRPKRPHDTLLVGDMGPDTLYSGSGGSSASGGPMRNNGTLPWDDRYEPGVHEQSSWLTARHLGGINVLTVGGAVQRVVTRPLMGTVIQGWYESCAAGSCTLCSRTVDHYSFAASQTFWWTGPLPSP